jgi:hypothetical protein
MPKIHLITRFWNRVGCTKLQTSTIRSISSR